MKLFHMTRSTGFIPHGVFPTWVVLNRHNPTDDEICEWVTTNAKLINLYCSPYDLSKDGPERFPNSFNPNVFAYRRGLSPTRLHYATLGRFPVRISHRSDVKLPDGSSEILLLLKDKNDHTHIYLINTNRGVVRMILANAEFAEDNPELIAYLFNTDEFNLSKFESPLAMMEFAYDKILNVALED